jgi:hypothetical protein
VSESFPQSRLRGPRTETEGPARLRIATEVCDAGQIAQSLGPRETRHPRTRVGEMCLRGARIPVIRSAMWKASIRLCGGPAMISTLFKVA